MIKRRILVVDDDKDIRKLVENILQKEGFMTVGSESGSDALKKIQLNKPDLVILDLQLPDRDGFEVCRVIRADPTLRTVPVVMLTVQSADSFKVAGLEMGADDYITKPFKQTELIARVKALFRRVDWKDTKGNILKDESLELDTDKYTATVGNEIISLAPKEFDLLVMMMKNPGKVFSRPVLLEAVWGQEYVNTRTVDVHIGRLRRKLGERVAEKIKTVERLGYRYE